MPGVLGILGEHQASDAKHALAPTNWQPGEPLLAAPSQDLDAVFAAGDITGWFPRDKGARA